MYIWARNLPSGGTGIRRLLYMRVGQLGRDRLTEQHASAA